VNTFLKKTIMSKTFCIEAVRPLLMIGLVSSAALLSGCATTGSRSPSARPVFYPNAKLNNVGQASANADADACISAAESANLSPEEKNSAVAHDAAKGAAMGGVAGAVGGLVTGHGIETSVKRGVAGAAVGGSVGAVNGAFDNRPNQSFRHYVQRCLKDKGYDVIGWN
jgi:outer membrane lipoprotein SlyB